MSSTRHASPDAPLAQNRYMSSPEYVEQRGLSGSAVAAKAGLLNDPRQRSLLFFLEARSHMEGGLLTLADDFAAMYPGNLGSPSMHKAGIKPWKKYDGPTAKNIHWELNPAEAERITARKKLRKRAEIANQLLAMEEALREGKEPLMTVEFSRFSGILEDVVVEQSCQVLLDICRQQGQERLEQFLMELCINPQIQVAEASVPYFKKIVPALMEYQERFAEAVRADFVETEVSRLIFQTLDLCLESRKIVICDGREGIGKTKAAETWCRMHLGQARFIRLEGVTNRTLLFRAICKALGLPSTYAITATDMQARIRDHLERSGIMLLIDEAHRLFPQSSRIYTHPDMMNWIYTLWDVHIPVALMVTPQFKTRLSEVERQTDWRSGQLMRRVRRYQKLPDKLEDRDLHAIARKLLPEADLKAVGEIADLAGITRFQLDSLENLIDDARLVAKNHGRENVTLEDVEEAKTEYWSASTAGIVSTPANPIRKGKSNHPKEAAARLRQSYCNTPAEPGQEAGQGASDNDLPDAESGESSGAIQPRVSRLAGLLLKS